MSKKNYYTNPGIYQLFFVITFELIVVMNNFLFFYLLLKLFYAGWMLNRKEIIIKNLTFISKII